ncbi:MAG: hypothetical protein WBO37_16095 [Gammaproteobacteria bacterium]
MNEQITEPFRIAFKGRFENILRWEQLDLLLDVLGADADGLWYIYAVGEPPPAAPASGAQVRKFLAEIFQLLRTEHDEDYCGIVFTDSKEAPTFVKIFDPNNLGVSCGYSDNPPLPGWILSKLPPVDMSQTVVLSGNRRRWWRRFLQH